MTFFSQRKSLLTPSISALLQHFPFALDHILTYLFSFARGTNSLQLDYIIFSLKILWVNCLSEAVPPLPMLSAGAALQGLAWAGIQDGSLTHRWRLSWGLWLSTWVLLHKTSSCFLGFLQSSKRYHYTASLPPHSVTKIYQDELNSRRRGKGSLFMIHHSTKFTRSIEEK